MADYVILSQVERNEINPDTGDVEAGRRVQFKDQETGVVATVFVTKDVYSPDNVDLLIRHELSQIRGVHGLGR